MIARCEASGRCDRSEFALKGRKADYLPHFQCGISHPNIPDVSRLAIISGSFAAQNPVFDLDSEGRGNSKIRRTTF
jgi:hypothetical protein